MNEEKEATAVLRYIRETSLCSSKLHMKVTISYLKAIRELLDEEIDALVEESK